MFSKYKLAPDHFPPVPRLPDIDLKKLNEMYDEAFRRLADAKTNPPAVREPDWRKECFELIAILRDETQSRSVHERCCALLKKISESR